MLNIRISRRGGRPLILLLGVLLMIVHLVAHASAAGSSVPAAKTTNKTIETFYSWLNAPWTDDDAPYRNLRHAIDMALANPSSPATIIQQYEDQFRKSPTDSKALFAFVYSAFKASELPNGIGKTQFLWKFDDLYTSIGTSKIHPPHTYNFARLGFLGSAFYNDPALINIGRRLLNHSPNDDEVEYYLATALNFSKVPADRNQAVSYQQDLARRFPNSPRPYRLLGLIYYRTAWLNHSQADADKSIAAYQRAFELSPKTQADRSENDAIIKFIQNLQAQWKRNG